MSKRVFALFVAVTLSFACGSEAPEPEITQEITGEQSLIRGLERLSGGGAYRAGAVESFRLLLAEDADLRLAYEASGGSLQSDGDELHWQLPGAGLAELEVLVTRPEDGASASATFRFLVGEAGEEPTIPGDPFFLLPAAAVGAVTATPDTESSCDLAISSTDVPHVIFRSNTHPSLWYATFTGGAWQAELVDGMGFDIGRSVSTYMSLALDAGGNPHIAYRYQDGEIRYARKSGGVWLLEKVSSGTYATYGVSVRIALDPASSSRPTIMWTTTTTDERVILAYRTGTDTWVEALGPLGAAGDDRYFVGGLGFESNGTAWFTFVGDVTAELQVGTWTAAGAFGTPASTGRYASFNGTQARLAFDGGGSPVILHDGGVEHRQGTSWSHSDIESFAIDRFDLAWNGTRPVVGLMHGSALELVTPNARGYWLYTEAATGITADEIGVAVDSGGVAHACYTRDGDIYLY